MDSPKTIKQRFHEYILRLERRSKRRLDAYFEELIRACDIQVGAIIKDPNSGAEFPNAPPKFVPRGRGRPGRGNYNKFQ